MVAVQIPFVKKLQKNLQETNYTNLKYKNEIRFVLSLVFIRLFLRLRCFRNDAGNFEHFMPRKPPLYANFELS